MGSDSDLRVMNLAVECLKEFGIACEVRILSAHRTP
ncbi:MAG: 5-(carboxyamino)imidazole ribonucleotide mutase, partial [Proteobacteria bacterium]